MSNAYRGVRIPLRNPYRGLTGETRKKETIPLMQLLYGGTFVASLLFAALYIWMWHKHFDINFTMIFTLIPVACLGYLLSSLATTMDGALTAQKIIYIGGSFLQLFIVLCILNLCQIPVPRGVRTGMFILCTAVYASVLTIGHSDLFYSRSSFEIVNGEPVLLREYGFMHTVFYALVGLFLLTGLIAIVYSWRRKKEIPRRILLLLVIPDIVCVLAYFVVLKLVGSQLDLVPLGYVIAELTFVLIAYRINLYDVSDTIIDSYVQEEKVGYVSFDFRNRYLGSNAIARQLVPELAEAVIDQPFGDRPSQEKLRHFLDSFRENRAHNTFDYPVHAPDGDPQHDRFYNAIVNDLYDGNRCRGYIITFIDDTANKRLLQHLDTYNAQLNAEVDRKTQHILEMHDHLIMSLATMVESRDNSTGGHIKRTSEGVRLLVGALRDEGRLSLTEAFCRDLIKAAPMHDLGKIAVDDSILRKPGRFTPEEFAQMKRHSAEGARVIHEILLHTDDESFRILAENVAHYHHERWDGSGYPDGLAGERIPLEARIMAIADVYDALVSRRVYKEAFDFDRAHQIILEGMGTQFDPGLRAAYERSRPALENYYRGLETA